MTLNVNVKNKVASFQQNGSDLPVCGNSGYKVKFDFDEEWNDYEQKTARFIWGGKYHDVEFTGDTCDVPVVSNTQTVLVGAYAGEMQEDGFMLSTTLTSVPFLISTRCGTRSAQSASGENYTNEAKGAAAQATEAADRAEEAADRAEATEGLKEIGQINLLGYDGSDYEGHLNRTTDYYYWDIDQETVALLQQARFVSIYGYETAVGGHMTAIYPLNYSNINGALKEIGDACLAQGEDANYNFANRFYISRTAAGASTIADWCYYGNIKVTLYK